MSALLKTLFCSVLLLIGFSATVAAQQVDTGTKHAKHSTEAANTTSASAKKTTSQNEKSTAPPNEKSNWAIRIKQGEKWYQLSLELAF